MTKTKILTCAALSAMVILVTLSGTAYGITGNYTPSSSPYVGIVVLYSDVARTTPIGYCSGVLISPTLVLTAGHATIEAAAADICFDKGPITYTIDENGKLISIDDAYTVYTGTPTTYPEYENSVFANNKAGNHLFDTSDLGIIELDKPVTEVTDYATLPEAGFANTLPAKTNIEVIGYGMQVQITPKNNGVTNSWTGTLSCNAAQTQLVPSNFAGSDRYLKLTANPSQDKGGVAFGDSGGPVIYQATSGNDVLLAINAYASSANCNGVTYHTRLDVPEVLDWINSYI